MGDLRVLLRPPDAARPHTEVIVSVSLSNRSDPWPIWVGTLVGSETDFLQTLVTDVVNAWAYGERPKDVAKAAIAVRKAAVAHAALYDF